MGRPSVLLYGFSAGDSKKIRPLCDRLGLKLRKVLPEEYGQRVGFLAGQSKASCPPQQPESPMGEMIVLSGVTERQLESFLTGLRTIRVGRTSLKAVLTETNARWTGVELYQELQKERASMGDVPVVPEETEEPK